MPVNGSGTCAKFRCSTILQSPIFQIGEHAWLGVVGACCSGSVGCTRTRNWSSTAMRPRAVLAKCSDVVKFVGPTPVLLHAQKSANSICHHPGGSREMHRHAKAMHALGTCVRLTVVHAERTGKHIETWHEVRATPDADTIRDGVTILQHQLLLPDFFHHALQRETVLRPPVCGTRPSLPTCCNKVAPKDL